MANQRNDPPVFVVHAGPWRIALLGPLMIFSALLFFGLALVMLFVDVGDWCWGLAFWPIALLLAALAVYFLLIVSTLAMRVEVGPDRLLVRVPDWRGGVMPWLPWVRTELRYDEIGAVETRDEVYSSFGIAMIQTAYSLVTKAGHRIVLGYTSPIATWNYPFAEAVALIGQRAGTGVRDIGAVWVGGVIRSIVKGLPSWDTAPMPPEEREKSRGKAALAMQIAFAFVVIAMSIRACTQH